LSDPVNGDLATTSNGSVTVATISCPLGYSVNGSAVLTCRLNGNWDEDVPNCGKYIVVMLLDNTPRRTEVFFYVHA